MSDLPKSIHIYEQGPREGFQFEKGPIPTARKIELVDALSTTGIKHIQVCSFVPAKNVPGMADAEGLQPPYRHSPPLGPDGTRMRRGAMRRSEPRVRLTPTQACAAVNDRMNIARRWRESLACRCTGSW